MRQLARTGDLEIEGWLKHRRRKIGGRELRNEGTGNT